MIPPLDTEVGALPAGRFATTVQELAASELVTQNQHREDLFAQWQAATNLLRSIVPVCVAWIGGSFLTDKPQPGDIDSVYIIEMDLARSLGPEERQMLAQFSSGPRFKTWSQLQVDSFTLTWIPVIGGKRPMPSFFYHQDRGYWDDLWSKKRSNELPDLASRFGAIPRRGYLEVMLDGFPETGPHFA